MILASTVRRATDTNSHRALIDGLLTAKQGSHILAHRIVLLFYSDAISYVSPDRCCNTLAS